MTDTSPAAVKRIADACEEAEATDAADLIRALADERDELDALLHEGIATDADSRAQARAEALRDAERLWAAARNVVLAYQETNPMRTADMHKEECGCLRCEIDRLRGALEDIHDGEPEWPDEPEKELIWCRDRARAALSGGGRAMTDESTPQPNGRAEGKIIRSWAFFVLAPHTTPVYK